MIVQGIESMAARTPELRSTLQRPGAFLDIGTGVGWLAIEAARVWPALRVVGIDQWEPALAFARENLGKSGVAERIELRLQCVEDLEETARFSLAWLPGPFIAAEIAGPALKRLHRALVPGGWLIFGLHEHAPGPIEQALASLRIARNGGHNWTQARSRSGSARLISK
jgi:methylase of polypeptide subunit release factors